MLRAGRIVTASQLQPVLRWLNSVNACHGNGVVECRKALETALVHFEVKNDVSRIVMFRDAPSARTFAAVSSWLDVLRLNPLIGIVQFQIRSLDGAESQDRQTKTSAQSWASKKCFFTL